MKWVLAEADEGAVAALAGAGLHPLIARLLVNRGILDPSDARSFLSCDLSALSAPGVFSQMERAAERVRRAIASGEKIVVYGDYDVDGVTGTSLLYLALTRMGAAVESYIPDRMTEGYGLNNAALGSLKTAGAGLVISVDCGITAVREADHARSLGLDLIITDHHEFTHPASGTPDGDAVLPRAYAILHPALTAPDVPGGIRTSVAGLTGVGVAFKLAQALLGTDNGHTASYLDLVTLGTVADVGRITGENRILVRHGLDLMSSDTGNSRPGIAALKRVSGLEGKKIGVGTVGFSLAPRINASGRLTRADTAFRLLTTESQEEALKLAAALDAVNRERQAVEESIREEARDICRSTDAASAGAIVLSSDAWHPGVIGIVASRMVEEFYRPTALICIKNGVGKGSARSIPGFDLYEGLVACSDLLLGFGGHKYAAGFTIAKEHIDQFRKRLGAIVRERVGPSGFVRSLTVDGSVELSDLTLDLMRELDRLAPYGQGNPEPRLGARDLEVLSSRVVGSNHLKMRLKQGAGTPLGAIAFNRGDLLGKKVRDGARLAAVFTPKVNAWNGTTSIELEIRDIKTDRDNSK